MNLTLGAALAMGGAFASFPAQAAGGLLEQLFGSRPTPQPVYHAPPASNQPRMTPRAGAASPAAGGQIVRKARKPGETAKAGKRDLTRPEVVSGPLGAFLRDPTLKRGDVVVTSQGLKIYTGPGGRQHSENDFLALAQAGRYIAGNTGRLIEIERANRHLAKPAVENAPPSATATDPAPQQRQAVSEGGKTL